MNLNFIKQFMVWIQGYCSTQPYVLGGGSPYVSYGDLNMEMLGAVNHDRPKCTVLDLKNRHFLILRQISLLTESPIQRPQSKSAHDKPRHADQRDYKGPFRHVLLGVKIDLSVLASLFGEFVLRLTFSIEERRQHVASPIHIFFGGLLCIASDLLALAFVQPLII